MRLLGVVALAAVLLAVLAVALLRRRYDGRFHSAADSRRSAVPATSATAAPAAVNEAGTEPAPAVSLADVGIALPSERVTVVQFSGEFCATCPQARTLVERVLQDHPEIAHLEVDVADHLEAVRALDIRRTPTLVIVDRQGRLISRASGMPREVELREAVSALAARR